MEEQTQPAKKPRKLRNCLIVLAWLVSLIALCYGVIDWRGRQAWNEYRKSYEARVASLDLRTYTPKPIPDSENFAATPFVQSWFDRKDTNFLYNRDAFGRADQMMANPPKRPHYEARFEDLAAWQEALAAVQSHAGKPKDGFRTDKLDPASRAQAATAVLEGMKDDEAALEELRSASARSDAFYPVVYDMEDPWGILLPHLAKIKQTCRRLEVKSCAELAVGEADKAFNDVILMLYVNDTAKTEPFLISYLVRLACANIAVRPIWEGLAEHRWTDAQLKQLQARLESYDWLADMQKPLHAEGAAGVLTVDLFKRKGLGLLAELQSGMDGSQSPSMLNDPAVLNLLGRFFPSGWYDQEKTHYCQMFEGEFNGGVDVSAKRVYPRQLAAKAAALMSIANKANPDTFGLGTPAHGMLHAILHHEFMAAMLLPSQERIPGKTAKAQTATDQAAVACALERYRLANGQFPENLPALVPRFAGHLPNDVITGEPFKYRRLDDGRFILYSVGWNETDDNGVSGKLQYDETEGDWVWKYPAS